MHGINGTVYSSSAPSHPYIWDWGWVVVSIPKWSLGSLVYYSEVQYTTVKSSIPQWSLYHKEVQAWVVHVLNVYSFMCHGVMFSVSRCYHWHWARRILSERRCRDSVCLCCCLRGRAGETSGDDFSHQKCHCYWLVELRILVWFVLLTMPALAL